MKGIQFVMDDKGKKTAVLINLKEWGELWEDFYDSLVAQARAQEHREMTNDKIQMSNECQSSNDKTFGICHLDFI